MRITERAESEINKLESFRIGLTTKGCNGFSYEFSTTPQPNDSLLTSRDFEIYIDEKISIRELLTNNDAVLDYKDEDFFKGFVIVNPEELSRCGCGKSFYL